MAVRPGRVSGTERRPAREVPALVLSLAVGSFAFCALGFAASSLIRDNEVVVFFKDAGKFKSRYATLGFKEAANLDDGPMWPTSYAAHGVDPSRREEGRLAGEGRRLVAGRTEP
jgi:hypothetical protein